jgi:hypothetical protein
MVVPTPARAAKTYGYWMQPPVDSRFRNLQPDWLAAF